ncbi:MAG: NAD(P)H-dependent glycerol-3-phosphate dehydrogenase [Shimia sp.]
MKPIAILGGGAFGVALAVSLPGPVVLWARGIETRESPRLPGVAIPDHVTITRDPGHVRDCSALLFAVPMAALTEVAGAVGPVRAPRIACCKGIEPETLRGPSALLAEAAPGPVGVLTGPSFATEIAAGLPTALTLAMADGAALQDRLSHPGLRVYLTDDVAGAELGGALKNVLAIAAGAVIGAGLGQSAQAALLTRGFGEVQVVAAALGARPETMTGLSGMGDLMLTAFSPTSRNHRFGLALGRGEAPEAVTTEGRATAAAIARIAAERSLSLPVLTLTHRLIAGEIDVATAVRHVMERPLKRET